MGATTNDGATFANSGMAQGVWVSAFVVDTDGNATDRKIKLEPGKGLALNEAGEPDVPVIGGGGVSALELTAAVSGLQSQIDSKQPAGSYSPTAHAHTIGDTAGLQVALDGKQPSGNYATGGGSATGNNTGDQTLAGLGGVPTSRTIAGKPLSADVTLAKSDVGLANVDNTADSAKTFAQSQVTNLGTDLAAKLATAAFDAVVNAMLAVYRNVYASSGSHIAGRVAGNYALANGSALAITGVGTLYPVALIHIDSTEFPTINGKAAKLRVKAFLEVNDVAPTGVYTVGLFPVTRPATSGGAGLIVNTIGAIVAGSGAVFTTPAADAMLVANSSADFAVPTTGFYLLGVTTTTTVPTSSLVHVHGILQARNA